MPPTGQDSLEVLRQDLPDGILAADEPQAGGQQEPPRFQPLVRPRDLHCVSSAHRRREVSRDEDGQPERAVLDEVCECQVR